MQERESAYLGSVDVPSQLICAALLVDKNDDRGLEFVRVEDLNETLPAHE